MSTETANFKLSDMLGVGLTLVVLGIGVSYGLEVMGDVRDDTCTHGVDATTGQCTNSTGGTGGEEETASWNATDDAMTGVSKLPSKLPLIATVVIAAIVIGVLVRYLAMQYSR